MANGLKKAYVREKEFKFGKTEVNTKVIGKMTEPMVTED